MTHTASALAHLRAYLTQAAHEGTPVTYRQACDALGLTPPGMIQALARMLEASMHDDAAADRPFLAALVISQSRERRDLPAPGFFASARALGRLDDDAAAEAEQSVPGDKARRFHEQELQAAKFYYG